MNFYGHALLAAEVSSHPAFVAGAMLPDFSFMLRTPSPILQEEGLMAGVRFHHDTDRVFHALEPFRHLERTTHAALSAAGVLRGTARAIAHVGVELLLDEHWAAHYPGGHQSYRAALAWLLEAVRRWAPQCGAPGGHVEAQALFERLLGAPAFPEEAGERARRLVARLERVLGPRPRLALRAQDRSAVLRWAVETHPDAGPAAAAMVPSLRQALVTGQCQGVAC